MSPGLSAVVAVGADGAGVVALGQPFAPVVADQAVVVVDRCGQAERRCRMTWILRGLEEVRAAGDMGDALGGVIDHDREVVGGAHVAAGEDDVADAVRERDRG
jgi:hypothetical protein